MALPLPLHRQENGSGATHDLVTKERHLDGQHRFLGFPKIFPSRITCIFLLTNSQNMQLNRFDTRRARRDG